MIRRIGVDLGGTKTEILLSGDDPLEELERQRVPTHQERGYDFLVNQLADLIKGYVKLCDEEPLIGLGIPGTLIRETGRVRNSNTQCLLGQPLKQDLESLVGLPVAIENDANCFALSEALYGAGQDYKVVMGLIMGTGMGGGLVFSGQLWSGLQEIAGEWGHSTIHFEGPECWCGQKGCLEQYISGTGLANNYERLSGKKLGLPEIYQNYEKGHDPAATETISDLMKHFGIGISNLIVTLDPDIIVIGGGVSNIPLLYTEGVEQIRKRIFNNEIKTPIVKNALGDSSGIFGAALIAG